MAMYSLNLMRIALELAQHNHAYEDIASKFFEHFLQIAEAMAQCAQGMGLWDDQDGFFYDVLYLPDGRRIPLRVRSIVGLIPLFAVETLDPELLEKVPISRAGWSGCSSIDRIWLRSFLVGMSQAAVIDDSCHCCGASNEAVAQTHVG